MVGSTDRNSFCPLFPGFPPWTPQSAASTPSDPLLPILGGMLSTLRSASALAASWGGLGGGDRPTTVTSSEDSIWYWKTLTSTRRVAAGRTNARGATVMVPHAPQRRSARRLSRSHRTIRTGEASPIERARCLPDGTRSVDSSGDGLVKIGGGDSISEDIRREAAAKIGEGARRDRRILGQRRRG
jgi:hypothetical protein